MTFTINRKTAMNKTRESLANDNRAKLMAEKVFYLISHHSDKGNFDMEISLREAFEKTPDDQTLDRVVSIIKSEGFEAYRTDDLLFVSWMPRAASVMTMAMAHED